MKNKTKHGLDSVVTFLVTAPNSPTECGRFVTLPSNGLTEGSAGGMLECDFNLPGLLDSDCSMQHGRTALQKIMGELLESAPANEAPTLAWPLVCGQGVAKRTRVLGFRSGVLRIEVPDVAWRNQLNSLLPSYLNALNQTVDTQVKHILFLLPGENFGFEQK